MPHPDAEHSLRIQLATALADAANLRVANDAARATTEKWLRVVEQLRENLNVTLLERDALRAENGRLREALTDLLREDTGGDDPDHWATQPERRARAALAGGGDRG